MNIQTSRFGEVQLSTQDIIRFPEGLLGFNDLFQFALLEDPEDEIFAWLQSCDDPNIAFPILEPELFIQNYKITLTKNDLNTLQMEGKEEYRLFSIVTIPENPTQMTANLKAPIVINIKKNLAKQCVLQDNKLAICEPIFSKLQQRVVTHPQKGLKERTQPSDQGSSQSRASKKSEVQV